MGPVVNMDLKLYHDTLWYYRDNDKSDKNYLLFLFLVYMLIAWWGASKAW